MGHHKEFSTFYFEKIRAIFNIVSGVKDNVATRKERRDYGLVIVKKLVEQNNGTIEVSSVLHKETEFTLKFPETRI